MVELKTKPKCCGKPMHYEEAVQTLVPNWEDCSGYTCLECGRFITIIEGFLDEEDLENYKETYVEVEA